MSPVNLGDLSATAPAPTGLVQTKRGAVNTTTTVNNTVTYGSVLQDGGGAGMFIDLTPPKRGYWVIHGQTMWLTDGVWDSFEVWTWLNPADLNGWTTFRVQNTIHPALSWTSMCNDAIYSLEAGIAYRAHLLWGYSSGYNQTYHCHPNYHYIEGEFIGEGSF